MSGAARTDRGVLWLNLPSLLWMLVFFAAPTLLVVGLSFRPTDLYGGIGTGWTTLAWQRLAGPGMGALLWRTLWASAATTLICLVLALPCAYFIARRPPHRRGIWLMALVLPFWTSFLVRILAWKVLLHPEGFLKGVLTTLGLVSSDAVLLYNMGAVLLVLVYTHLPFAVLPLYAAAEKFDFSLLDAARDLGAGGTRAFVRIFVPGIAGGVAAAVVMVFIPALGTYVIPDLVGGPSGEMLGNKIAQRSFSDRNLPLAAALATALTLAVSLPMLYHLWRRRHERGGVV